jgi:hypothetical protein
MYLAVSRKDNAAAAKRGKRRPAAEALDAAPQA